MAITKLLWSGRSQSVRLPKGFRFNGDRVRIRRHGKAVIIEPMDEGWGWLDALAGSLDEDFVRATEERPEPSNPP
jgi:antitoxin VapB